METHKIPAFADKIIRREASGETPDGLELVAPTIVRPGERFSLKAVVLDKNRFPVLNFRKAIRLRIPECNLEFSVRFPENGIAYAEMAGIMLKKQGVFRFEAKFKNRSVFSNPCVCSDKKGKRVFWGDPHIHSALSNCMIKYSRSLSFGFNAARYLSCLDWAAFADHVSNGRCGLDKWKEQTAAADAHDDPGNFASIPAYEASLKGGKGGDNNVYMDKFPSMFIDDYEEGSVKTICEKLKTLAHAEKFDFFVIPHHTTRTGKHGEIPDDIYPGEEMMPAIEIHSKWGTSEYRGNPSPLQEIHPGPSYATDLLNRKMILGFVAGTDTHATMTFAKPDLEPAHINRLPGLTAACAEKLDRRKIFQAIRERSCYAACGERIYLAFQINNIRMGSKIKMNPVISRSRHIHIECAGKSDLASVEIMRDGQCIKEIRPETWKLAADFDDEDALSGAGRDIFCYYYIRVRCQSGATAWSSPIWITSSSPNKP